MVYSVSSWTVTLTNYVTMVRTMVSPSSFFLLPSSFFPCHDVVQDLSRFADFIWVVSEIRFDFVFQSLDPHSTTLFEDSCDQVINIFILILILILTPLPLYSTMSLCVGSCVHLTRLKLYTFTSSHTPHTHMNPSHTQTLSSLACTYIFVCVPW